MCSQQLKNGKKTDLNENTVGKNRPLSALWVLGLNGSFFALCLHNIFGNMYQVKKKKREEKNPTTTDWCSVKLNIKNEERKKKNDDLLWAESEVPQSNESIIAAGEELERRLELYIQHTGTTTKLRAQSAHTCWPAERSQVKQIKWKSWEFIKKKYNLGSTSNTSVWFKNTFL